MVHLPQVHLIAVRIYRQIARDIRSGNIPSNARLHSSRTLSTLLKGSRNTILTAYEELVSAGLIRGVQGAGMCIHGAAPAGPSWQSLRTTIRAANYPAKVLSLEDPDGNPFYLIS